MAITDTYPRIIAAKMAYELDDGQHPGRSSSITNAIKVNKLIRTGIQNKCTLKQIPKTQRLSKVQHKAKTSIQQQLIFKTIFSINTHLKQISKLVNLLRRKHMKLTYIFVTLQYNNQLLSVLLMLLPYIAGLSKKKVGLVPNQQLLKQWLQTKKQLETRVKSITSKISIPVLNDLYKVCILKQIPDFYVNFLILSSQKQTQERLTEIFSNQITEIINERSHYHIITSVLDKRPQVIKNVQSQLQIVQGFQQMNSGKTIKASTRLKINQLLKQATSLQDIKSIQHNSIAQLAKSIMDLRKNTSSIVQSVKNWRQNLLKNVAAPSSKKNKVRIMFPKSGINCVLLPLYDQASILNSFLSNHFQLSKQNNPFLLLGKDSKKRSPFQQSMRNQLNEQETKYQDLTMLVLAQLPVKEDPQQKQRQQEQRRRQQRVKQKQQQKINKIKQMREKAKAAQLQRQQKQKEMQQNKKDKKDNYSLQKIKKEESLKKQSKSVIDIQGILMRHKQKLKKNAKNQQSLQQGQNKVKPISVQQQRTKRNQDKQQDKFIVNNKKRTKQVIDVYSNKNKPSEAINTDDKIKDIINQKAALQRQLKDAKNKNKEFQKLVKKLEKEQVNKNKKLNPYIKQSPDAKKMPQIPQISQQQKRKNKNTIQIVYKSRHQRKNEKNKDRNLDNSQVNVQQLINQKRSLLKQLKQQIRQRNNLQKLLKKTESITQKRLQKTNKQKQRLQSEINILNRKVSINQPKQQTKEQKNDKTKQSMVSVYVNKKNQTPISNINQSKLIQQRQQRVSLQKQMKELIKEKNKLQKIIERSDKQAVNQKKNNNSQLNIQQILNDKLSLEKQLKDQIRQKKELQKILKKTEGQVEKKLQKNYKQKELLQSEIKSLKSKIISNQIQSKVNEQKLQKSKASVVSVYLNEPSNKVNQNPTSNLYESKLLTQKQQRVSLQKQMKELIKEKAKLQKTIQKSESQMMKEKQSLQKKMQKYQQTIHKLKQQQSQLKSFKLASEQQTKKKRSESLRMYTTSPLNQIKQSPTEQKSLNKPIKHIQSANIFKLPPQIKKARLRQKTIDQKEEEIQEKDDKYTSRKLNKVQIIQTKKTIEIIYQGLKRKKKKQRPEAQINQQSKKIQNEQLQKIKKQKQNLIFQLERQKSRKQQQQKARERKAIKQQGQIQKYKQIIQRQRQKKYQLQAKIRSLKKDLFDQFDQKLKDQKMKFQSQKRELMQMIQNQKNQKQLKQKYLHNQIKFLREMQANQNQLLKLLQGEKKNRLQKQKQLAAQIAKKEQLLQLLQIEQIKKGLQSEIRKQLQNDSQEDQNQQIDLQQKKQELRIQIQQMNDEKNEELQQIDEQNQKLKALITRIKQQQSKLISAIKQNINEDTVSQQNQLYNELQENQHSYHSAQLQVSRLTKKNKKDTQYISDPQNNQINKLKVTQQKNKQDEVNLQQTQKIFNDRLRAQQQHEAKMKRDHKIIRQSPQYKQKQQVQNLIEMYLQNPHQYPPPKKRDYSPQQRNQIKEDVLKRSKLAGDFQKQLMKLKQIQKFVPTSEDDMMTSHLLNLKRVYEQKQSSALKQELFPSIKSDEKYHDKDLSFESQQIPPKTLRDHVDLHAKNFVVKKSKSKNFLSINRMRVAMLEQNRRQKQRELIQQQAKKRAQADVLKRNLRMKQQQRIRKEQQKRRKLQQQQKDLKNALRQNQKPKKLKKKNEKQTSSEGQDKNKSLQKIKKQTRQDNTNQKQDGLKNKQKIISQHQKQEEELSQLRQQDKKQQNQQQLKEFDTENLQITNKHSSLDKQRKSLQEDVYQYQQQIRSFVSRDQNFDIYQQFVQNSEIISYVQNLVAISNEQIKALNNNQTLYKDIPTYKSLLILVAKDKSKQVEVGIAVLHKQPQDGLYVCDYIMAHNMRNFLNLLFNICRFIFKVDKFTNKIQFYFDLSKLQNEISIIHFIEFEQKCKRMGQVYVKVGADKTRKYVLRRNLFQPADKKFQTEGRGLQFTTSLQIHSDLIRQRGYGFQNNKSIEYFSSTALLAFYMKKNEQILAVFRKNAEDDLKYRQLLLTTLMFQKKQVQLKNYQTRQLGMQQRLQISHKLHNSFTIQDPTHQISQTKFSIQHFLSEKTKRCTFQIDDQQISYVILPAEEAVTKIQSSNSSQTGIFMSLVPKYKMLIIEASQFINMNKVNPEINVFFYIKHFIKNISDVSKQQHPKIFIPQVSFTSEVFLKDLSDRLKVAVFAKEKLKFGWSNQFNNSIIFNPSHKDLVIKKPFIISLLSASIERVIQGTPLFATVIL